MSRQSDMTPCDIDETLISRIVIAHSISNLTHNRFWFGRGGDAYISPLRKFQNYFEICLGITSRINLLFSIRNFTSFETYVSKIGGILEETPAVSMKAIRFFPL